MSQSALERGRLVQAVACDRQVRVLVVVVDGPVRELVRRHKLGPISSLLAAEGVAALALLSGQMKGDERQTARIFGENPKFSLEVDLYPNETLRARFEPADLSEPRDGLFDGLLAVQKFVDDQQVYRGVASVEHETIEAALQRYYLRSIQTDAIVRIHAALDNHGAVRFAAGILVERFPDMPTETFHALFDDALRQDFRTLMTTFAFGQLAGSEVEVLDARDLVFRCPCSLERARGTLAALGADDLEELLAEQGHTDVSCHFCNETYAFDGQALRALIDEIRAQR